MHSALLIVHLNIKMMTCFAAITFRVKRFNFNLNVWIYFYKKYLDGK